jgi:polyferredoxin
MINKIFKKRYLLTIMQFFTLTVFVLLIYGAIGVTTKDADFAKILRNTNLSNLIVWSYWWPLIITTAILFGRFWCTICPVELVTSLAGGIGLKRQPGIFLKSGWVITLFYAIILVIGIHTYTIHRVPQLMAVYMLILFSVSVIVGLIWEKRTFCTYICPIGHLLGLYSLMSFKKLRVINPNICKDCSTKDCISKENHYKFIGRSCTSELYPANITDNRKCILCGQCHKSCINDNIAIKTQRFSAVSFSNMKLSWAEIAFFMLVSSFVIYEIGSEWNFTKSILMSLPKFFNSTFEITGKLEGTIKAVTLFIILPSLFYFFFVILKKAFSKETWKQAFIQLVIAILPITVSMHLLKALLKTSSRIPYWNFIFSDPEGVKTAKSIMEDPAVLGKTFLHTIDPYISILAILLSIGGMILSFLIIRKQKHNNETSRLFTYLAALIYASIFLITLIYWKVL